MTQLPKAYIVPFIAQLYLERKGEAAPEQLLANWQQLPAHEIDKNLSQLFQNWGMTEVEKQLAIERFLQKLQATQEPVVNQPIDTLPPEPVIAQYAKASVETEKKRSPLVWILALLVIGLLGFVGIKYAQYASLSSVYAITENIAIRDAQGQVVARMDLFAKDGLGVPSYSKLRAMDGDVHYMKYGDSEKEFPNRKVMMDSVGFIDFLLNQNAIAHYVNTNYVVNDKAEFDLYQGVFNEVQKVANDNNSLIAPHRKVIVGSMAKQAAFTDKYIVTNTIGLNKSQISKSSSIIVQELVKNQQYVIIAGLSDGNYYRFEGDIKSNTYKAPEPIYFLKEGNREPLTGNYRFAKQGTVWALYDVATKSLSHNEIRTDADKKYAYFEYNAPEPLVDDSIITPQEIIDTIKSLFN